MQFVLISEPAACTERFGLKPLSEHVHTQIKTASNSPLWAEERFGIRMRAACKHIQRTWRGKLRQIMEMKCPSFQINARESLLGSI